MELRWIPSPELSSLHAAILSHQGVPFTNVELGQAMEQPARQLFSVAKSAGISHEQLVRHLPAQLLNYPGSRELSERVLRKTNPAAATPNTISSLSAAIAECHHVFGRFFPKLSEELVLRIGPLQSLWEARGPGLLAMIRNLTEPDMIAESAAILLVQPIVGGYGAAHLDTNAVHIEALLTDAIPQLPETLRLAWLLAQLQLDRPMYGEQIHGWRLPAVAARALLPIAITAAEDLQLAAYSPLIIEKALVHWLRLSPEVAAREQLVLAAWWETQRDTDYDWPTALTGLSMMLGS